MTDREHIQTMLTVARRYWLEQATQAEIAAEIGYSRSMVSRLLDEARPVSYTHLTLPTILLV